MRVRIRYEKGVKGCYNYAKVPCFHNKEPEICKDCYVWAGHGNALLFTEKTITEDIL